MPNPPTFLTAIERVQKAWDSGRKIVPIVGAGLSSDSGIPVVNGLQRYFRKFQQFLACKAMLPPPPIRDTPDLFEAHRAKVARWIDAPWEYVDIFGWPDRYELTNELYLRLRAEVKNVESEIAKAATDIVMRLNPLACDYREGLRKGAERELRKHLKRNGVELKDVKFEEGDLDQFVPDWLFGDWRQYIQHFTRYQGDRADALFHRLCGRRLPSLGHRYLAWLVKLLAVRAVFTFNFDDLIEQALQSEGVEYVPFAMEHGHNLPAVSLVSDVMAVVKMHGSTHSLLLDQRLDYPLPDEYKRRFKQITGRDALLLVVGCSGGDRRLTDLLVWMRENSPGCQVVWLHFEPKTPRVIAEFCKNEESTKEPWMLAVPTHNPGQSLQHIYAALAGRHPASTLTYAAHVHRPYRLGEPSATLAELIRQEVGQYRDQDPPKQFVLLSSQEGTDRLRPVRTASEALIDHAAHWLHQGYQIVWVDLESAHTLSMVVGSIVDQCRALDTQLPPSVLPIDDRESGAEETLRLGLRRVREALRRSRCAVMIDGLEAYLWGPTSHHGEPNPKPDSTGESERQKRLEALVGFFGQLPEGEEPIASSVVIIGIDDPKFRSNTIGLPNHNNYQEHIEALKGKKWLLVNSACFGPGARTGQEYPFEEFPLDPPADHPLVRINAKTLPAMLDKMDRDTAALVFMTIVAARRGRQLGTLRQMLRPLLRTGKEVDALLDELCTGETGTTFGCTRLEGGGLWFTRSMRDRIYSDNTRYTNTQTMSKLLSVGGAGPGHAELLRCASAQLILLTTLHLRLARTYYTHVYVQSQDAITFLEYTYHRVSAVRYLVKLISLLDYADPKDHDTVLLGIGVAGKIARGSEPGREWKKLWRWATEKVYKPVLAALKGKLPTEPKKHDAFVDRVREALKTLHRQEIIALGRGWARAEPNLRTQLPADQLISWCNTLLDEDVPVRMNRVPFEGKDGIKGFSKDREINGTANDALSALRRVITDFSVKLLFERSDFPAAVRRRWEQLEHDWGHPRASDSAVGKLPEILPIGSDLQRAWENGSLRLVHFHYLIDVVVCFAKTHLEGDSSSNSIPALIGFLKNLQTRLANFKPSSTNIIAAASGWTTAERITALGDYHEANLRILYVLAELEAGSMCVFAQRIGFLGLPAGEANEKAQPIARAGDNSLFKQIKLAEDHIEQGLADVRTQAPRADGRLRSLILDPTDGGGLYIPYRTAFHTQLGRMRWLKEVRRETYLEDPTEKKARIDDAFASAFQSFDMARGGRGGGNHQIAALNELHRVEACLARARLLLYWNVGDSENGRKENLHKAMAKYETARGALQTARRHLLTGRRNVIWWKLFFAMSAQYHADRMLLGIARDFSKESEGSKEGSEPGGDGWNWGPVVRRLKRAYQCVRSALDLYMPVTSAGGPTIGQGDRLWLERVWIEITAGGYCYGRLMSHKLKLPEGQSHEVVRSALLWMNQTTSLIPDAEVPTTPAGRDTPEASILKYLHADNQRSLFVQIRLIYEGALSGDINPYQARWKIIEYANSYHE